MFSKATEYALRAVIYIAQKSSEEKKLGLPEIARAINTPRSFTAKILQQLTSGKKIIQSSTGPGGGFFIAERAKKLPVRVILEVMEKDYVLDKCVLGLKKCSEASACPMHSEYKHIKVKLKELFESKTIQDLANELEWTRIH